MDEIDFPHVEPRTRLSAAVLERLEDGRLSAVTTYSLFFVLSSVLAEGAKGLYLREGTTAASHINKVQANLLASRAIETDRDYGRGVYRVLSVGESTAEDACALVNPFGHISHLSAMQRWGLTERRPEALHLTMPPANAAQPLIAARMAADYGTSDLGRYGPPVKLRFIGHPEIVRRRKIEVHETKNPAHWIQVRDSYARLATVGQVFVDTIEKPQYCGGMAHVLDVWRGHADTFCEEIIGTVDSVATNIAKVRAGYLLDEMLGMGDDPRVQGWARFAQRGGSRVLDPTKKFAPAHSRKWMLSINV